MVKKYLISRGDRQLSALPAGAPETASLLAVGISFEYDK